MKRWLFFITCGLFAVRALCAEAYPSKPVQTIFPFGASGGDALIRVLEAVMSELAGQQFVLFNKPGAAGAIGAKMVARADPDGYTLLVGPSIVITNLPYVQKGITYDPDSFEYVCQYAINVISINVRADSPYKTLTELIAAARSHPGQFRYGHLGRFTDFHLSTILLANAADITVNDIPYGADANTLAALLRGDVEFSINSVVTVANRPDVRTLAVFGDKRHPSLPEVPSVAELGLPAGFAGQQGIFAPKGTPRAVLSRLERICKTATESARFRAAAKAQAGAIYYLDGDEFKRATQEGYKAKGALFHKLGVQPQ